MGGYGASREKMSQVGERPLPAAVGGCVGRGSQSALETSGAGPCEMPGDPPYRTPHRGPVPEIGQCPDGPRDPAALQPR